MEYGNSAENNLLYTLLDSLTSAYVNISLNKTIQIGSKA